MPGFLASEEYKAIAGGLSLPTRAFIDGAFRPAKSGKTMFDCETVDVPETINCLTWHAEPIDKIHDQSSPASDNRIAMILREPAGVVGPVLPGNFPLLMLAWKIGPALASGCSAIVKPAEETSLTALRVAELALDAGIPAGVFNVLPGSGPAVEEPLGRHMDVDMVSFTGSTETGRRFLRCAAESNLKEVTLEMGGKNPAIVLDDAENLDRVAAHIANGAFWNMGENCSATSRLIVQKGARDELLKRILAHARAIRAGTVTVNSSGEGDITTPFGGFRSSGFGGRDDGIHAHDQYTEIRTIWPDLADGADQAVA